MEITVILNPLASILIIIITEAAGSTMEVLIKKQKAQNK